MSRPCVALDILWGALEVGHDISRTGCNVEAVGLATALGSDTAVPEP